MCVLIKTRLEGVSRYFEFLGKKKRFVVYTAYFSCTVGICVSKNANHHVDSWRIPDRVTDEGEYKVIILVT